MSKLSKRERYYVQRKAISRLLFYYSFFSDLGAKSVSDLEKDRFSYASLGQVTVIIFLMYIIIMIIITIHIIIVIKYDI